MAQEERLTLGEILTGLSYLTGALVFLWAARRQNLSTEGIWTVVAVGFAAGILGAKLTQLIAEGWPWRVSMGVALDPRNGGRALLGGVIFGWIGVVVAKKRLGIRRPTGDLFALALPAGEAVGRLGCYFNGCCYGERCDMPWAVWQHGAYRHPAQLYSAAVAVSLFGFLLWLRPRLTREGDLFKAYLVAFGVTRFGLEFVRWRETLVYGLSPMQWFCLELVLGVAAAVFWRWRREAIACRI
ncbi:prolipoprotein diacylglyceryl transferase [Fimbriimonas ginsengisoli]|uniref:Prolipoprotein diacylglyceryl transferase n=1 Tax=Fimbriimonas ginsengisoli Gsoil 348 TaxID=661478 RepID=A0A068NWK7_FIMGI|nr:prolipoprotein diacylglyceryl transferase family protein [Fimbriimonas ginsengisoli]AIE87752.1 prolipoprotein diacylglyceryl transferase [Fimbriimonas ginsengisoli Gsoil 348]